MADALAAWGARALDAAALPLAAWTLAALAVEAALRLSRAHAAVGLPVRRAALWALPLGLAAAALVRALRVSGETVQAVADVRAVLLPEISAGAAVAPSGPPAGPVLAGLAVVAAGLVGAVAVMRLVRSLRHLGRLRLPPAPPDVQAAARRALADAGVAREVRVAAVAPGTIPFTFGHRRPTVAVPAGLTGDALDLALAHEAAHVRAGDFAAGLADRVLAAVFAAHPLAAVLVRGLEHDRERRADAAVLARHAPRRRAYADLLVSFAARPAPRLALGAAPGSFSLLDRLTAMTRPPLSPARLARLRRSGRIFAFALGLAVVALAGWTSLRADGSDRQLELVDPTVHVGGALVMDGGRRITQQPFRFLFVHVPGVGRFVVSDQAWEVSRPAGQFNGARLFIPADGDRPEFEIRSATQILTGAAGPVQAHLVFMPLDRVDSQDWRSLPPTLGVSAEFFNVTGLIDAARAASERPGPARTDSDSSTVFEVADENPVLVGGLEGLTERLVYPADAFAEGISGTTIMQFVVSETGRVRDLLILRSAGDARLDSAAVQTVRASTFEPGRNDGQPVATRFALPVRFALPATER